MYEDTYDTLSLYDQSVNKRENGRNSHMGKIGFTFILDKTVKHTNTARIT